TASALDTGLQASAGPANLVDLKTAPEVAPVARPEGLVVNRPTIPMADYLAAKNAAAARPPGRAKSGAAPPSSSNVTFYTQTGSTNESQTTGGNRLPPDG